MEKLSIEQKAKRYDEAIERAKEINSEQQAQPFDVMTKVFPELKESDENESDENIRKALVVLISVYLRGNENGKIHNVYAKDMLAWLEKQGTPAKLSEEEQNRFAKSVLTSCALSFIDYLDAHKYEGKMRVSNGECEDIENAFHNAMWDKLYRYYCKYIEKQGSQILANSAIKASYTTIVETGNGGVNTVVERKLSVDGCCGEQKPFDYENANIQQKDFAPNVELKFKVGDWITDGYVGGQITSIEDNYPCYKIADFMAGINTSIPFSLQDNYHLWTIQDAKEGDVLVNQNGEMPFIFKEHKNNHIYCYCGYTNRKDIFFDRFVDSEGEELHWLNLYHEQAYPATKEQCALLFQKMHEAGYEWDDEKKELKKIETKFHKNDWVIVSTTNGDRVVQIASVEYFKDGRPMYITTEGRWFGNGTKARLLNDVEISTIAESKAIKSWSEEDKNFMYDTLSNLTELKDRYGEGYGNVGKCIDWLKSLKGRYTWKPSDEQMYALDYYANSLCTYCDSQENLRSLFNDLKKLRRE